LSQNGLALPVVTGHRSIKEENGQTDNGHVRAEGIFMTATAGTTQEERVFGNYVQ